MEKHIEENGFAYELRGKQYYDCRFYYYIEELRKIWYNFIEIFQKDVV